MGRFSWFRRRHRTEEYVGRHRPGAWGDAPAPGAPTPAVKATVTTARQRVHLGFADGTSVDIEDATSEWEVLRQTAARLMDGRR